MNHAFILISNLDEKLQGGFIVGHSLLTAYGIPCSGEGDLKTAVGMKICDILGTGGIKTQMQYAFVA